MPETDELRNETKKSLHERYEPERPIHHAVNISSRRLKDRIQPVEHDEFDLWKAEDSETGRTLGTWWDTAEKAVEMLSRDVDLELCHVNECMVHLGEDSEQLYCDDHYPEEYIECAEDGCDYPTAHTETDHCTTHTWRLGRSSEEDMPSDGGERRVA